MALALFALLPGPAIAGKDGLTCGEYDEHVAKGNGKNVDETVHITLAMAFDRFPQEIAKSLYEKWHKEGISNAYEASLNTYVETRATTDLAVDMTKSMIAEMGVSGFMKQFCLRPDISVRGIAYNMSLAAIQATDEQNGR